MQLRTAGFASLRYVVISVWETSATSASSDLGSERKTPQHPAETSQPDLKSKMATWPK